MLTGKSNEERAWNHLNGWIQNSYGVAALMGNLFAESGLNPKNLQNSSEKKLGFTDETYTAAVDSGSYKNFVKDSAGYGIAQWTYWSRKENMIAFARAAGKSIGDLEMQLDFLCKELSTNYKSLLAVLKTATSVRAASDSVLLNYERPADQSEAVRRKRAGYGQTFYDRYAVANPGKGGNTMTEAEVRQKVLSIMQGWVGLKRSNRSHAPIIDTYNRHKPLPRNYKVTYSDAYCATTVSAAAIKAGFTDIMPVECSCSYLIKEAQKKGIWRENDAYVPKPADEILYDWDDGANYATTNNTGNPEHVGMVEKVVGKDITVIEGNMNGGVVGRRTLKVNGRYIRGFITPDYASKASSASPAPTSKPASASKPTVSASSGNALSRDVKWNGQTTTSLKVRKWAGTENPVCGFSPLKDGEIVGVCDEVNASDGSKWYYIKNKDGKYGFSAAKHIKAVGTKSVDEIAKEVIKGEWGNGTDRKKRLTAAGYDYKAVQKRVTELSR